MDHLDPCAGPVINETATNDLVSVCKNSMKWNPKRRPHLTTVIDVLQETQFKNKRMLIADACQ
eukprot:CAMPEP_0116844002 /NCGR_PEP_ID=MMETSP0418-20121206/12417_1 /TAXON_ID=1158023 /ORGANISM="Astrosyne radiata, Strain 13vi08-1A" /LENGTH=62 /DNA_ID=CAMNT_0004474849 /DNA_START=1 /DNA_END=186 /DNA_ORIENTATION=+